ncbi:hypothetical protein HELRODRAFT_177495 [Helobdella robusta]|uniref:CCHC-type domain-containing protein n=1 Tax=Helobdella robusta TaxID=6412 RepID=T1FBS7_HELRO|nr:hypothetical protein HELRODRAFT_177495 [Helobdella robusta]ESN97859.1 hypothetical protein HELRODRAFT_177495 [Helobdella robusta]
MSSSNAGGCGRELCGCEWLRTLTLRMRETRDQIDAKLKQQSVEIKQTSDLIDAKIERMSGQINAKIEQQSGLEQKLSCKVDKFKQELEETKWWRYEILVNALNLRYGEEHMKQIYRSELQNRMQQHGESIQLLAQDIEQLTLLSYPTYDPQHRKETALETFVKAVRDLDLRQTLILVDKRNFKDAVAYSLQSAKQALKTDVKLRQICEECSCQKLILEQKGQDYGAPKCWNCEEKGHLRPDCKQRPRNNYCRHCAAT